MCFIPSQNIPVRGSVTILGLHRTKNYSAWPGYRPLHYRCLNEKINFTKWEGSSCSSGTRLQSKEWEKENFIQASSNHSDQATKQDLKKQRTLIPPQTVKVSEEQKACKSTIWTTALQNHFTLPFRNPESLTFVKALWASHAMIFWSSNSYLLLAKSCFEVPASGQFKLKSIYDFQASLNSFHVDT